MNRIGLVSEVSKVVGDTNQAQAAVDCIFETITRALKGKNPVSLTGFGTFKVAKRKGNPQTGEIIEIKEKSVPKFIPGKALKDAVAE
jgi:DNA-binding protein HU-beta